MTISAQSQISEGEMDNLAGLTPDGFLGVRENASSEEFLYFYLIFQDSSFKFYIYDHLLYWENADKNPEDDLKDGRSYVDLLAMYDVKAQPVRKIHMKDYMLTILLETDNFYVGHSLKNCVMHKKAKEHQIIKIDVPKLDCKCGHKLGVPDQPFPNELLWLMISDVEYDNYTGLIDLDEFYQKIKSFLLKCSKCERLAIFWDGFENDPTFYEKED